MQGPVTRGNRDRPREDFFELRWKSEVNSPWRRLFHLVAEAFSRLEFNHF
jgi:hypothetical protein